jgi:hypothetical protein
MPSRLFWASPLLNMTTIERCRRGMVHAAVT